jgi:orotate phosphoribosyltransferase
MVALAKFRPVDSNHQEWNELREIVRKCSFRRGRYVLSSGRESELYFNMKPTMMLPKGGQLVATGFLDIAERFGATYVGGLAVGAVPTIGTMVGFSSIFDRPMSYIFVRNEAKAHGTKDVVEGLAPGETLTGKRVLVVDDVATSGKSILKAVTAVRDAGGIVEHAACIVDRDEGGTEALAEARVVLHSLLHARDFMDSSARSD